MSFELLSGFRVLIFSNFGHIFPIFDLHILCPLFVVLFRRSKRALVQTFTGIVVQGISERYRNLFLRGQVLCHGGQSTFNFLVVLVKQGSYNACVHDIRTIGCDRRHTPGQKYKLQEVVHWKPNQEHLQRYFQNIDDTVHDPVPKPMFPLLVTAIFYKKTKGKRRKNYKVDNSAVNMRQMSYSIHT